jgi:hypothetical protein
VTLAARGMATLETATPNQSGLVLEAADKSVQLVSQRLTGVTHSYQMG